MIYFAFSDESGTYQQQPGSLPKHAYYLRATFLMDASDWRYLYGGIDTERHRDNLPKGVELKWSYLHSLHKHELNNDPIGPNKDYAFLRGLGFAGYRDHIERCLKQWHRLSPIHVVLTVTDNHRCKHAPIDELTKWHLQETMQRLEMEIQAGDNLGVMFVDSIGTQEDKTLRRAYNQLWHEDDFITRYAHLKDGLSLDFSHHSIGIQMADYIAGISRGWLCGYPTSSKWFSQYIKPHLRRDGIGRIVGYGVREVPKDGAFRTRLQAKL